MQDKNFSNIRKIVISNEDEKAIGRGRIGKNPKRFEAFDPNAIDGDGDGIVQELTQFERPATPRTGGGMAVGDPRKNRGGTPRPKIAGDPDKYDAARRSMMQRLGINIPDDEDDEDDSKEPPQPNRLGGSMGKLGYDDDGNWKGSWEREPIEYFDELVDGLNDDVVNVTSGTDRDVSRLTQGQARKAMKEIEAWEEDNKELIDAFRNEFRGTQQENTLDRELRRYKRALQAQIDRKPLPAKRLGGAMQPPSPDMGDDDDISPQDQEDLRRAFEEILDEIARATAEGTDFEAELEKIVQDDEENKKPDSDDGGDDEDFGDDEDEWEEYIDEDVAAENEKRAQETIDNIKNWLKDHPFNPDAQNFVEFEWAQGDQARRYAPEPWGGREGDSIDWDALLDLSNLRDNPATGMSRDEQEAYRDAKMGPSASDERARALQRLLDGESIEEIANDMYKGWQELAEEAIDAAAEDEDVDWDEFWDAKRASERAARQRKVEAWRNFYIDTFKDAKDEAELKRLIRRRIDAEKETYKRASNEYQMIRKKQVELWVLANSLFKTMPEQKKDESNVDYSRRLYDWFDQSADLFTKIAEGISYNHDVSTATARVKDYQARKRDFLENLLNDKNALSQFFKDLKNRKNPPQLGGGMSTGVRGIRIAKPDSSKSNKFADDAVERLANSKQARAKQPLRISPATKRILDRMRAAQKLNEKSIRRMARRRQQQKKALGPRRKGR